MIVSTSGSESRSGVVLELAEEFLERYRAGERPSLKEYIDRHPGLAAEIRDVFPAMAMMEKIALVDESLDDDQTIGKPTVPIRIAPFEQLGDYRIIREVGRGGMGVVYEAEQVSLGRHVALKVLPAHALANDKQKHRFEREARAAARLHHTNIVPVFGVGEHEGVPYYVMQFIQGMGIDVVIDELKRMKAGGTNAQASFSAGGIKISRRDETAAGAAAGLDHCDDAVDTPNHPRRDVTAADLARSLVTGRFRVLEPEDGETDRVRAIEETVAFDTSEFDAKSSSPGDSSPVAPPPPRNSSKLSDSFVVSGSAVSLPGRSQSGEARKSTAKGKPPSYWESVASIGVQTASALEYAHNQGIQHRDVKPSNLLLDTHGTVWITDFGLAKADDQRNITETGDLLGTLRYMPPEAFEGRVDTRGDIYALGITLYELLSFNPAFDESERGKLVKRVTTEDAPRLGKIDPTVPADLETIVHKAIDRDPNHRYPTAGEMAADLERFIADEPIAARRLSLYERANRWRRRNPAVAGLSAALLLLMATAMIGSMIAATRMAALADQKAKAAVAERNAAIDEQNAAIDAERSLREARVQGEIAERERIRADASLRRADLERKRAEEGFATARSAVDDYLTKVSEDRLTQVPGLQPLRHKLLLSALAFYQDFLKERSADALIRAGLAEALVRAGKIQIELGDDKSARSNYQTALEHFERLTRDDASNVEYQHGMALCLAGLGRYHEAIAIWTKIVKPDDPRFQRDLADALNMIAISNGVHLAPEQLEAYRRALGIREMLVRLNPDDAAARRDLAITLYNLAFLMNRDGRTLANALDLHRRAVEHAEAAHSLMPHDILTDRILVLANFNLGTALWSLGRQSEAIVWMRKAHDLNLRFAVDNPAVPILLKLLYLQYNILKGRYLAAGDFAEAAALTRRTRAAIERTRIRDAETLYQLASLRAACAALPAAAKDHPTADETAERNRDGDLAIEALNKAIEAGLNDVDRIRNGFEFAALRARPDFQDLIKHIDSKSKSAISPLSKRVAAIRLKESEAVLANRKRAAAAVPGDAKRQEDVVATLRDVASLELALDKTDSAVSSLSQAVAILKELSARDTGKTRSRSNLIRLYMELYDIYTARGRRDEARSILRKAESEGIDDPRLSGRIRAELGKTDLAVADFIKALDLARDERARGAIFDESAVNPEVFARVIEKRKPTIAWRLDRLDRFGLARLWKQALVRVSHFWGPKLKKMMSASSPDFWHIVFVRNNLKKARRPTRGAYNILHGFTTAIRYGFLHSDI